jgi:tetratricopeptide (TPR) repeat protein
MTDFRVRFTTPARGRVMRAAQALAWGIATLAWTFVRPLALVGGWLRGSPTTLGPKSASPPLQVEPAASRTSEPAVARAPEPERRPARLERAGAPELVAQPFVHVIAARDLDEARYAATFAELQREPGSKLLDLCGVRTVQLALFTHLAQSWTVGRGVVPRFGILLDYERWALLHAVGGNRLRPIVRAGVDVEIFYAQQLSHCVPEWFAGRGVEHPLPAILEWLRTDWCPSTGWTAVLDTTAMLIDAFGHREMVADQLLQLAAITLAQPSIDGAAQSIKHTRAALSSLPDTPSRMHCRARRLLGSALRKGGEIEAGLRQLVKAIGIARQIGDRMEEATALAVVASHELDHRRFAHAEARCRAALVLLADDDEPHLRASLHHRLALALCEQGKSLDEAEHQATKAEELRWDQQSRLAVADRELRARIQALRSSPSTETMGVTA